MATRVASLVAPRAAAVSARTVAISWIRSCQISLGTLVFGRWTTGTTAMPASRSGRWTCRTELTVFPPCRRKPSTARRHAPSPPELGLTCCNASLHDALPQRSCRRQAPTPSQRLRLRSRSVCLTLRTRSAPRGYGLDPGSSANDRGLDRGPGAQLAEHALYVGPAGALRDPQAECKGPSIEAADQASEDSPLTFCKAIHQPSRVLGAL